MWTAVFCGDALFFGGKVLLQDIWDCSLQESTRSVRRLAELSPDGFFPGHLTFTLRNGRRHAEQAMRPIEGLLPPPQMG